MSLKSICTTSILTYILTIGFICVALRPRAEIATLLLSTTIWFFAFVPLIFVTNGDFQLIQLLLSKPASYFSIDKQYHTTYQSLPHFIQHFSIITYAVIFGSFLFSIFVPLDNETILQDWPIAPLIGSIVGFIIGSIIVVCKSLLSKPSSTRDTVENNYTQVPVQ